MQRILVIRGGAIGDFVLTLPALKLLRENFPTAHLEILGYKHIIALAENRFYANATRSIDHAPLSRFFARNAELTADLVEYFGGFDLIISYLFDPDEIFAGNLRRCGAERLIVGSPKFNDEEHAARQLARPLAELGLHLTDAAAFLFPNEEDRSAVAPILKGMDAPVIAIHPGSGSERKNWPLENWIELGEHIQELGNKLLVVGGEADEKQMTQLRSHWEKKAVRFVTDLPLPHLAAVLENAMFVGHDSGISHLAAAAGAKCILLFGPTDPAVWAPANKNVKVLRAPEGDLAKLLLPDVLEALVLPNEARNLCHAERSRGISH